MVSVAPEVADRIRRPVPPGLGVLRGSLPVAAFGDPDAAIVATMSLNPSWLEFQSPAGAWLEGKKRRLASLISLGLRHPRELDDGQVAQVVAESNAYFRGSNWYRGWFHWLEMLLRESGAGSYLDGSACHLDLVQWATKPAQRDLPAASWRQLVGEDREFLSWQLAHSNVHVVLVNGASVVSALHEAGLVGDWAEDKLEYHARLGTGQLRVFQALADGVLFLGWNRPLAGPLPACGRFQLFQWVAQALRSTPAAGEVPSQLEPPEMAARPSAGPDARGFIPAGTVMDSVTELEGLLARWLGSSQQATIGEAVTFGGAPLITVRTGAGEFVLNRD